MRKKSNTQNDNRVFLVLMRYCLSISRVKMVCENGEDKSGEDERKEQ